MPVFAEIDETGAVRQVARASRPPDEALLAHLAGRGRAWIPLDPAVVEEITEHPERFIGQREGEAWHLDRR